MIKVNLRVVMAGRKMNIQQLSDMSGVSRTTISALFHETGAGVQFGTLNNLCETLKCSIGDLLVYHEERNDAQ